MPVCNADDIFNLATTDDKISLLMIYFIKNYKFSVRRTLKRL